MALLCNWCKEQSKCDLCSMFNAFLGEMYFVSLLGECIANVINIKPI